jgi:hypothetical protein
MLTRRQLWRKAKTRRENEEQTISSILDDSYFTEEGIRYNKDVLRVESDSLMHFLLHSRQKYDNLN